MKKLSALAIIAAFALTPMLAMAQTATPAPAKPAPTATVKLDCTKVENKTKAECQAAGVKK